MKILEITKGKKVYQVKIDDEDVEKIKNHIWTWKNGYACTMVNKRYYQLHRMVMGVPMHAKDILVDHIDGNHLRNTKDNLRIADRFQNQQNRKTNKDNTLPKGVRKMDNGKYNVRVQGWTKRHVFGSYCTIEEAVEARNEFARNLHGQFFRESHLIEPKTDGDIAN